MGCDKMGVSANSIECVRLRRHRHKSEAVAFRPACSVVLLEQTPVPSSQYTESNKSIYANVFLLCCKMAKKAEER